jgi:hypothetical protein
MNQNSLYSSFIPHPFTHTPFTEKPMRRAPVRGWWALPVAAGLTFLAPVHAQLLSFGGKAGLTGSKKSAASAPIDEELARLTEINVGLAWLADPLTFPCQLAAHVQDGALEIRGFVPNEAVRSRAVKVAREQSKLSVIGNLKLRPTAAPVWRRPPEELHAAIQLALKKYFPKLAPDISVLCRPFGQVILTGRVESMEEKLALSQSLRRVPGCSSVLNQLEVGFTTTTAAAPRPAPGPVVAQKPAPAPVAAPKVVTAQATVVSRPQTVETPIMPRPQAVQTPMLPLAQEASHYSPLAVPASKGVIAVGPSPAVPSASPYSQLATPAKDVPPARKAEMPVTSGEGAAAPSPYAASTVPPTAVSKAYAPRAPEPARSNGSASSWTPVPAPKPVASTPLPSPQRLKEGPVQIAQAPPVPPLPTPATTNPDRPVAAPVAKTAATPPSAPAAGQVVQTSYRPEGVPLKASQSVAQTSPKPVAPDTKAPAASVVSPPEVVSRASVPPLGEPYMTRGLLILGDVGATPPAPPVKTTAAPPARPTPAPPPRITAAPPVKMTAAPPVNMPAAPPVNALAQRQALLKHAIVATCGPAVQDVEVEIRSSTQAMIRFRAANKAEADRLWNEIQRVPELTPYKLDAVVKTP